MATSDRDRLVIDSTDNTYRNSHEPPSRQRNLIVITFGIWGRSPTACQVCQADASGRPSAGTHAEGNDDQGGRDRRGVVGHHRGERVRAQPADDDLGPRAEVVDRASTSATRTRCSCPTSGCRTGSRASNDLGEVLDGADLVVVGVPSQFYRAVLSSAPKGVDPDQDFRC